MFKCFLFVWFSVSLYLQVESNVCNYTVKRDKTIDINSATTLTSPFVIQNDTACYEKCCSIEKGKCNAAGVSVNNSVLYCSLLYCEALQNCLIDSLQNSVAVIHREPDVPDAAVVNATTTDSPTSAITNIPENILFTLPPANQTTHNSETSALSIKTSTDSLKIALTKKVTTNLPLLGKMSSTNSVLNSTNSNNKKGIEIKTTATTSSSVTKNVLNTFQSITENKTNKHATTNKVNIPQSSTLPYTTFATDLTNAKTHVLTTSNKLNITDKTTDSVEITSKDELTTHIVTSNTSRLHEQSTTANQTHGALVASTVSSTKTTISFLSYILSKSTENSLTNNTMSGFESTISKFRTNQKELNNLVNSLTTQSPTNRTAEYNQESKLPFETESFAKSTPYITNTSETLTKITTQAATLSLPNNETTAKPKTSTDAWPILANATSGKNINVTLPANKTSQHLNNGYMVDENTTISTPSILTDLPDTPTQRGNITVHAETSSNEAYVLPGGLIAVLVFGVLMVFGVLAFVSKKTYDSWSRRQYKRIDYLINGMYN